jgi:hypothetical protein
MDIFGGGVGEAVFYLPHIYNSHYLKFPAFSLFTWLTSMHLPMGTI